MAISIYYLLFLIPSLLVIGLGPYLNKNAKYFFFILYSLFLTFFIGLRYEIGGDWYAYLSYYEFYSNLSFSEFIENLMMYDPLYVLINYIAGKIGGGIYLVNTIEAFIFIYGYTKFSLKQKKSFLAFLIGIPYLVIVVSMGYTRQAMAIGFIFLVYNALIDGKFLKASILNLFAVLSHKTAIIIYLIIFATFIFSDVSKRNKIFYLGLLFIFSLSSFSFFFLPYAEKLLQNYIINEMKSEGGFARILMNLIPSLIFLIFYKKMKNTTPYENKIWLIISFATIITSSLQYLGYSTVADRINLYFSSIQMSVYGKFIDLIKYKDLRIVLTLSLVLVYFLTLFVWLNFAVHRDYWIPYKNLLFELLK